MHTINYLKAKFANLSERKRYISIVIDEVHTHQQVAYIGEGMDGLKDLPKLLAWW